MSNATHIHATSRGSIDPAGLALQRQAEHFLGIETGRVVTSHVYSIAPAVPEELLTESTCNAFGDPILSRIACGSLVPPPGYASRITVDKHAGVTDDEGKTAWTVLRDLYPNHVERSSVRSRIVYWIEAELPASESYFGDLESCFSEFPVFHRFSFT